MPEQLPDDGTCAAPDCDEPTPWDMAAIIVGEAWYCSPECAGGHLNRHGAPAQVTLHDPQFAADRAELPHVADDAVDISRRVTSLDDADTAIAQATDLYPGTFRVEE